MTAALIILYLLLFFTEDDSKKIGYRLNIDSRWDKVWFSVGVCGLVLNLIMIVLK